MNKWATVLLLFIFSCSAKTKQDQSKHVQNPPLYPINNYLNNVYDEPFFKEKHFGYPNDKILGDTTKYYYTSETIAIEDTVRRYFRNCEVTMRESGLYLYLNDTAFSNGFSEIKLVKSAHNFDVIYSQTFSIADSSYKPPVFKILTKKISLNKNQYAKGDSLEGKFALKIFASYYWEKKHSDTIFIYGLVKAIVK